MSARPVPPVTVAAPIVEKITESHRQLKFVVHDYLVWADQNVMPYRHWPDESFLKKSAVLIGYTGGK